MATDSRQRTRRQKALSDHGATHPRPGDVTDTLFHDSAFFDPDWISEGHLPFDEPHPEVPLRAARIADVKVTDPTSLAFAWEPRLRGTPFAPDDAGWTARARIVGLFQQYVTPNGAHGWGSPDACRAWDYATYANGLVARFFASSGKDVYYLSHPTSHGCLATATCSR